MRGVCGWRRAVIAVAVLPGVMLLGCNNNDDDDGGVNVATPSRTATEAVSTPTPDGGTPAATPTTGSETPAPTATPGGSEVPSEVQAFIGSIVGSFAGLANIADTGGGAGAQINPFPITTNCQGGGQVTIDCGPSGTGILYALDFANCQQSVDGVDTLLDGSADIAASGVCLGNPFPPGSPFVVDFDGSIETEDAGGPFTADVDVVMDALLETDGTVRLAVEGTAAASCFSETVTISTPEEIVIPADADCPTAGVIDATFGSDAHSIAYTESGAVDIDLGADGSVDDSYSSCDDESLETCGS